MNTMDIIDSKIDPWSVLDISVNAGDNEIEQAWRDKLSTGKNRDRVHLAYKMIACAEDRIRLQLLSPSSPHNLEEIQNEMPLRSRYSGPGVWYNSLRDILNDREESDSGL